MGEKLLKVGEASRYLGCRLQYMGYLSWT